MKLDDDDKRLMRILLASVILLFLITPFKVSGFSDDFNDGDMADWTLVGSDWSAVNYYAYNYAYDGGVYGITKTATMVFSGARTYWTFELNHTSSTTHNAGRAYEYVQFLQNSTNALSISLGKTETGDYAAYFIGGGFAYTMIPAANGINYKVIIKRTGMNLNTKIYYPNGTLYNDQTGAITSDVSNPDRITLGTYVWGYAAYPSSIAARFDNVVVLQYEGYVPPGEPFGCDFMDFSGLGSWDVVGHIRVILSWLYHAPACYLSGLFSYLYTTVYNIVMIPVGLITNLFTWVSGVISNIVGLIGDIYALMGTVTSFLTNTIFLLLDNAWIAVMSIGLLVVIAFRIKHLLGDTTIAGFKIGRG